MRDNFSDKRARLESRRARFYVLVILAISLALSLASTYRHRGDTFANIGIDASDYRYLANSLLTGHQYAGNFTFFNGSYSYDSTHRAPAYPVFLAIIYAAANQRPVTVYLVQAFMFPITLYLVYLIFLRVMGGYRQALISTAACALWPFFYADLVPRMWTEMLASFLAAAGLLLVMVAIERKSVWLSFATGAVLAAFALTKAPGLLFALSVPVVLLLTGKQRAGQLCMAVAALIGVAVLILPWTIRNYRVTGAFIPVTTGSGLHIWLGNHRTLYDEPMERVLLPQEIRGHKFEGMSTVAKDRLLMADGVSYIGQHPLQTAGLFGLKFCRLWLGELGTNPRASHKPIPAIGDFGITRRSVLYVPVFILAVLGWFLLDGGARRRSIPILVLLATWTFCYVLTVAGMRHAGPLQFYVLGLAGITVSAALRRFSRGPRRDPETLRSTS